MDAGDDIPWQLGAQVSPTDARTKVGFALLRELSREESEHAQDSSRFLERLASATGYPQLVEAYQQLQEALKRQSTPERRVLELNAAARALGTIAAGFPDGLRRSAEQDFEEASEQRAQIEAAIAEETARPAFQLLVAVGALSTGPYGVQGTGIAIETTALAKLAEAVEGIGPGLDLMPSLLNGVIVAQRLIGRQLQTYAPLIADHSLRLRRLAAEVPDGAACLIRQKPAESDADSQPNTTMDLVILPLDKGVLLHRALAATQQLLKSTADGQNRSANPPVASPQPSNPPLNPDPVEHEGSSAPQAAEGTDRLDDQVLDLGALAQHATQFCNELEQAWSGAMDQALLAEAQQETRARYASLLAAVHRAVDARDRALRDSGINTSLPAIPTPPNERARYAYDADHGQRVLQGNLAVIDALSHLLQAVVAMREPSQRRIFFDGRPAETWWDAGAFSLVRERAAHLIRMNNSADELTDGSPRPSGTSLTAAMFDEIALANSAYSRSDVEATVMHVRLALFQRAAAVHDDVPADLLERLARHLSRADHANALRLLEVAARQTATGELPDPATTALLAPLALAALGEVLRVPQVFTAALADGGSGGEEA